MVYYTKNIKMKSENEYIGDDNFKKFLNHYDCPTPLDIVKFRFAGAICSPNTDLRPTDVISSFWPENRTPRLETKKEAELFFKFFMGLWDEVFKLISQNNLTFGKIDKSDDLKKVCLNRYDILEQGFLEGFWGGMDNVKIPAFIAEIVDSVSKMAMLYKSMIDKINPDKDNNAVFQAIIECDKTAEKSIGFIIEHYVLPKIEDLKRTVH